ncbi:MAG: alpha/beta fold hydrolase [Streptosporangiaceae bacterium]
MRRVEAGAGEPAVVLEAGMNCGAASWQRVMPLLAPHVRVAAYDRAGLDGSAPAPGLAVIDRQVDDLASVITGLAAGPCVLAGHSWGGILVQLLAFRRPGLVTGLVLVTRGTRRWKADCPWPSSGGGGSRAPSTPMSCTVTSPRPTRPCGSCAPPQGPFPTCPSSS